MPFVTDINHPLEKHPRFTKTLKYCLLLRRSRGVLGGSFFTLRRQSRDSFLCPLTAVSSVHPPTSGRQADILLCDLLV